VLFGLTAATAPELVARTTALLLNASIPLTDRRTVIQGLATAGPYQANTSFHYLMTNLDALAAQANSLTSALRLATYSIAGLSTRQQLEQARAFFSGNRTWAGVDQALESIAARVRWSERDTADIRAWFGL
jgi:ERAP1-like C-terminal domain